MLITKRKPATVGEILNAEFIAPFGLSRGAVADAMGAPRKHVNELCNDRRKVTARTALILGRVFGNSAEFWLNAASQRFVGSDEFGDGQGPRRAGEAAVGGGVKSSMFPRLGRPSRVGHQRRLFEFGRDGVELRRID